MKRLFLFAFVFLCANSSADSFECYHSDEGKGDSYALKLAGDYMVVAIKRERGASGIFASSALFDRDRNAYLAGSYLLQMGEEAGPSLYKVFDTEVFLISDHMRCYNVDNDDIDAWGSDYSRLPF